MTTRKEFTFAITLLGAAAIALGACDSKPSQAPATPRPTATPFIIPTPEKLNPPTPTPNPETIQTDLSQNLPLDGSQSIKLTKKDGSNEQWVWAIKPEVEGVNRGQTIAIQTNSSNFDSSATCILSPCVYNGQNTVAGIGLDAYAFSTFNNSKSNQNANQAGLMDFALAQLKIQGAYLDCTYNSHQIKSGKSEKQVIDSFAACDLKYNQNHWTAELVSNIPQK
jgi:hypothetical protein